jgi:hypothetical protein
MLRRLGETAFHLSMVTEADSAVCAD